MAEPKTNDCIQINACAEYFKNRSTIGIANLFQKNVLEKRKQKSLKSYVPS